jgi:hypothetical protein
MGSNQVSRLLWLHVFVIIHLYIPDLHLRYPDRGWKRELKEVLGRNNLLLSFDTTRTA